MPAEKEPDFRDQLLGLFHRLDERSQSIKESIDEIKESVDSKFNTVESKFHDLYQSLDDDYVKRVEFDPVKKFVYGLVAFILLTFGGLFVTLVFKTNNIQAEISLPSTGSMVKQSGTITQTQPLHND